MNNEMTHNQRKTKFKKINRKRKLAVAQQHRMKYPTARIALLLEKLFGLKYFKIQLKMKKE